jgi:NADH-quinone oxidoreductase subunit G
VDEVPENAWEPVAKAKLSAGQIGHAITDFYLTNPIARASELMAELSANAKARAEQPVAAE